MSTPPYYCRECDEFDTHRHRHELGLALPFLALLLIVFGPACLVALYAFGVIP